MAFPFIAKANEGEITGYGCFDGLCVIFARIRIVELIAPFFRVGVFFFFFVFVKVSHLSILSETFQAERRYCCA